MSARIPTRALRVLFMWGYSMRALARMFGLPLATVEKRLRKVVKR